jgi:hypothetical protein
MPGLRRVAFLAAGLHQQLEAAAVQVAREARQVRVRLPGFGHQIVARQLVLAGERQVVHLPELALLGRRQRGFVGQRRFLVRRRGRVLEGEAHLGGIGGQQLPDHWRGFGAVGTLEIAELDQADGRRGWPSRGCVSSGTMRSWSLLRIQNTVSENILET